MQSFKRQTDAVFRCGGDLGTGRLFSQWTAINTATLYLVGREDSQFPAVPVPQLLQRKMG
jgi:hypothetical protein